MLDKPEIYAENDAIDKIYAYSNPMTNPAMFRILFISDIDLDWNYKVNASTSCYDAACCHEMEDELADELKAPLYGTTKCNLPLNGFKKMVDTINKLNTTNYLSFTSIIYGGSSNADEPDYLDEAQTYMAEYEIFKYLREKNPFIGLYYAVGPHDLYPLKHQRFNASG